MEAEARNPYAVSSASFRQRDDVPAGATTVNAWRDGKILVMRPGAALPHRCVKCNDDCDPPKKPIRVHWHHWTVYLLLLVAVLIYLIVGLLVRRKATVPAGLCDKHRNRRRAAITLSLLIFTLGLIGAGMSDGVGIGIGVLVALLAVLIGLPMSRIVWAQHISPEYLRIKGCGREFLDSLPTFRG
jgi:hypothetical protein